MIPEPAPAVAEPLSLAWLLEPLDVGQFLDEFWGREHHHVRRSRPDYFAGLLPTGIAELVGLVRHQPSILRLVRGADKKGPDHYRTPDGTLDIGAVRRDFANGYTVVVDGIEQFQRSIGTIARSIEVQLNFPTQVNAYVTPPGSRGLVPHYDDHDVLVLQIRGSKTWQLYPADDRPARAIQRDGDKAVDVANLCAPTEVTVDAGDVLYVPRGRVHAAHTDGEESVHLTVGVHAPTVLMLAVGALYSQSFRDDRLNARLPVRHLDDVGTRGEVHRLISEALDGLRDPRATADGLGLLADVLVRRGTCPPLGRIGGAVDGHTRVVKHQPLFAQVKTTGNGVTLQFASLSIDAAADHEDAMRFAAHAVEPFRVSDLPGLLPGQQVDLARTLLASGFLARVPDVAGC